MATRAEPRLPLGIVLPDRYELLRPMASGGMASVWCAQDLLLDRPVAIKLLSQPLAVDRTAVRRFKREARAAARLSGHPHVVTIYDVGQTVPHGDPPSAQPFIVMERLRGGTVADALRAAPVRPHRALQWLHEAAAAIDYAHGHGVIHRDIKPSNFLLDDARVLHVGDFGIALVATEETLTTSGQLLGTAAYMAPEVALGQPASEASDRYALAVAAFELLTGGRPFAASHFAAQARLHIEAPRPVASMRNPELPEVVDDVLAAAMAKRPEERFATATEFVGALQEALSGEATAAPEPALTARGPVQEYRRFGRRRPRRAAMAALAALLVAAAVAAMTAGGGGRPVKQAVGREHHAAPPVASKPATPAARNRPQSADVLEARGHQLMLAGDYRGAIQVLRQAVAAAAPGSLTYAYALHDLERSLRLLGGPQAGQIGGPSVSGAPQPNHVGGPSVAGGPPPSPGPGPPGQEHHGRGKPDGPAGGGD